MSDKVNKFIMIVDGFGEVMSETDPDGSWVLASDYAALEAECERLRAANGLVRQCIAEELESWTGDYREPVGRALHDLQQRIEAALSAKP